MVSGKIDLTGGMDADRELMFASRPEDPEMRDSASFWVLDERGEVGLPRIGIEAVASNWDAHQIQVNVAFADGRVYRLREDGASWPVEGPDGRPTVLGAGPLAFTCVRPFGTWTLSFDGQAVATSVGGAGGRKHRRTACGCGLPGGSHHGGAAVDSGHDAGRRRSQPQDIHRRRPDGRARATSSCSAPPVRCGWGTGPNTRLAGRGCAFAARVCAGWKGSGATAGSRRCSPAGRRSATSPIRRAPTASPSTTRATSIDGDGDLVPARVVEAPWLTRLHPVLGDEVPLVYGK